YRARKGRELSRGSGARSHVKRRRKRVRLRPSAGADSAGCNRPEGRRYLSPSPRSPMPPPPTSHPVVLFDGVCNLCNASINFVIDRDAEAVFRFAPLQSDVGRALVAECGLVDEDSIVLVEDGRCYVRSDAALRIARRLDGAWRLLGVLRIVPRPLRDAA